MADKELEIKLRATGGDAAAKEVEKVSDALALTAEESAMVEAAFRDEQAAMQGLEERYEAMQRVVAARGDGQGSASTPLSTTWEEAVAAYENQAKAVETTEKAVDDLGKTVAKTSPVIENLTGMVNDMTGSFNMGGAEVAKSGKGLFDWIKTIKGTAGQIAVVIAATQAYWKALSWVRDKLEEIDAASKRTLPELASTSQAAALETMALAEAEERLAEAVKRNDANVAAYTSRLRALANEQAGLVDAELGATLAQIDLDELNGNLSEAEAITKRYQAKIGAGDRKLALERQQLETELNQQRQLNALEQQRLREVSGPAAEAQGRLAQLTGRGASSVPELADQVAARNAAIRDRAQATTTDPEELDALDAAIAETQEALAEAYTAMVEKQAAEVDALVAKVAEASSRVSAGRSAEAALAGQLDSMTTGPAAQAEAARRREAELRMQAQQTRVQQTEEAARQKAETEAARAAATEAANAAARDAAAQAARMAGNAAANGGVPAGVVGAVENAAAKLSDGTTEQEIAGVMGRIVTALEGVPAAQQSNLQAALAPLMQRLQTVEAQLKNSRR